MTTTTIFAAERARLAALVDADASATRAHQDLCRLLELRDELGEAADLEESGAAVQHAFAGSSVRAMRERQRDVDLHLAGAAYRLRAVARRIHRLTRSHPADARHERMARGYTELAAIAAAVVWTDGAVDWPRVDAINEGLRTLSRAFFTEALDDVRAYLDDDRRRMNDLRAAGLGSLADRVENDPACRRLVEKLRKFAGHAPTVVV